MKIVKEFFYLDTDVAKENDNSLEVSVKFVWQQIVARPIGIWVEETSLGELMLLHVARSSHACMLLRTDVVALQVFEGKAERKIFGSKRIGNDFHIWTTNEP